MLTITMTNPALLSSATVAMLYPELERELDKTRRFLERFPDANAGWTPHRKSKAIDALASHIASVPRHGARVIETDDMDVATRTPPQVASTAADLLRLFDDSVAALRHALPLATSERLERPWTLRMGSRVLVSAPRRELIRDMLISHLVH